MTHFTFGAQFESSVGDSLTSFLIILRVVSTASSMMILSQWLRWKVCPYLDHLALSRLVFLVKTSLG
jgi:hypothetical protein